MVSIVRGEIEGAERNNYYVNATNHDRGVLKAYKSPHTASSCILPSTNVTFHSFNRFCLHISLNIPPPYPLAAPLWLVLRNAHLEYIPRRHCNTGWHINATPTGSVISCCTLILVLIVGFQDSLTHLKLSSRTILSMIPLCQMTLICRRLMMPALLTRIQPKAASVDTKTHI